MSTAVERIVIDDETLQRLARIQRERQLGTLNESIRYAVDMLESRKSLYARMETAEEQLEMVRDDLTRAYQDLNEAHAKLNALRPSTVVEPKPAPVRAKSEPVASYVRRIAEQTARDWRNGLRYQIHRFADRVESKCEAVAIGLWIMGELPQSDRSQIVKAYADMYGDGLICFVESLDVSDYGPIPGAASLRQAREIIDGLESQDEAAALGIFAAECLQADQLNIFTTAVNRLVRELDEVELTTEQVRDAEVVEMQLRGEIESA